MRWDGVRVQAQAPRNVIACAEIKHLPPKLLPSLMNTFPHALSLHSIIFDLLCHIT